MEWGNVQGGKLTWTPHPWAAHPLPHPDIPAKQFWDHAGDADAGQQMWRGPGGWMPASGLDAAGMHLITGGHPLPGMDPYWTPTRWVAPLYAQYPGVFLSPWLAPNPRNANCPHILWDAAVEPPDQIRRVTGRGTIVDFATTDFFKAPATHPSAKYLHVHLPGMRSSWGPVVVKNTSGISVGDVFNAVWAYLQTPISLNDVGTIIASRGMHHYEKTKYAMWRRCWSSAALYDYAASQGIKRVDLLEGTSVYWGFWLAYNPDGTWYLTMGFLPRTRAA
ncbi:hypothetical protein EW145_g1846 [Phellinidium pouzarii]|uniref:DUF6699 domain-containing protein n=1 Tax=Phellinidium pouzarii TaxID=167371 RepID=A0A4S4LEP7_9AGAM|nr:hypothetical protein EW145_g1846 [Phellinidium pouzarii]